MTNFHSIGSIYKGTEHFYISDHYLNKKKSLIYIGRNDREIFSIYEKLKWILPNENVFIFRSWDNIPYDKVSPSKKIQSERINTLYQIANKKNNIIVVTSVNAIIQKTIDTSFISSNKILLQVKSKYNFNNLINNLSLFGYIRSSIVREKSQFAIRGNIIDIYLSNLQNPIRLDFFDNTLESIKEFDFLTQKTLFDSKMNNIILHSSSEVILSEENIINFRENFRDHFSQYKKSEIYFSISNGNLIDGSEQFFSFFYKKISNIFFYCKNFDFILNNDFTELLELRFENITDFYNARINSNDIFHLEPNYLYLNLNEIKKYLKYQNVYQLNNFNIKKGCNFKLKIQPNLLSVKKENNFEIIRNFFEIHNDKIIIICAKSKGSLVRISKILFENIDIQLIEINSFIKNKINKNNIYITILTLDESVIYENKIYINEKCLFGYNLSSIRKKTKNKEIFLEELNKYSIGNILVHDEYGFCKFINIKKLRVDNSFHDCIELEFADNEKLFVPVENLNHISRYNKEENSSISLDKLGTVSWQKRKIKIKKNIEIIAKDLINNAANRLLSKSPIIDTNQSLYDKFVSTFPYVETEDQISAIEDIKLDFNKKYPTDRLIVGDVAYGKSEIIIRSIFLIAKSSLQSLILVPTTLLARQHYQNFSKRFKSFNINIKQISRLVPLVERKVHIEDLKNGKIDCIIGTHALLSDNIKFKNLGLIVIDEEQHFGVKAKEKLKKLSSNSHIISLSATPIPRTLQLSLSGIKELSLILTPPYERLSIRTYISLFDKITIKEAIKREVIGRKGGVFWVTPRKKDIPFLEKFLIDELPDIKYTVAHGQLPTKILEERITKFYENKISVLISTNIIESGLDLPNVNTIIIHRSNLFGLSQLHQLRGRIGRSANRRGYAYLTYQKETNLNDNATKRLNIINTYDKLGAGFNIASNDMDLRGSGNIIGTEQSGFIKEVGLELYNKLLEEEIINIRNDGSSKNKIESRKTFQPNIRLPESIFIPDNYINDIDVKVSIYKRISLITTFEEKEDLIIELIDRFGNLPKEVENLFKLIEIKILCYKGNINQVDFGKKGILISFFENKPNDIKRLLKLNQDYAKTNIRLRPDNKLFYDFKYKINDDKFNLLKKIVKLVS